MKTKEITLCGKQVTVAYCYATEIAFGNFTGLSIDQFDAHNSEHPIYLILSAIQAYNLSLSEDKKSDIRDYDIMYNATPDEIKIAFRTICELKCEWYGIPLIEKKLDEEVTKSDDNKEEDVDEESKNV